MFKKSKHITIIEEKEFITDDDLIVKLAGVYKVSQELEDGYVLKLSEDRSVIVENSVCRVATRKEILKDKAPEIAVILGILVFFGLFGVLTLYQIDISNESINLVGILNSPLDYILFIAGVVLIGVLALCGGFI